MLHGSSEETAMRVVLRVLNLSMLFVGLTAISVSAGPPLDDTIVINVTPLTGPPRAIFSVWVGERVIQMQELEVYGAPTEGQKIRFFAKPHEAIGQTGNFKRFDVSVIGKSGKCEIKIALNVRGLTKGDQFRIQSSLLNFGFENLTISKLAPPGYWSVIHEIQNIPDDYRTPLSWSW